MSDGYEFTDWSGYTGLPNVTSSGPFLSGGTPISEMQFGTGGMGFSGYDLPSYTPSYGSRFDINSLAENGGGMNFLERMWAPEGSARIGSEIYSPERLAQIQNAPAWLRPKLLGEGDVTSFSGTLRGLGVGLGGLTLGLGALNALDQYRHRNDDRNIRNRQLALSEKAQNFAYDNAQRQAASGQQMTTAYNKAHAEAMKWQPAIVNGRQVYKNVDTGQIALTRPRSETPIMAARGGLAQMGGGRGAPQPSRPVSGPGTGQSDEIPALLSDGEYVIDASTVADLGDGSTKAGAKALDGMVRKVRAQKRGGLSQLPPKAKKPEQYMKKGA